MNLFTPAPGEVCAQCGRSLVDHILIHSSCNTFVQAKPPRTSLQHDLEVQALARIEVLEAENAALKAVLQKWIGYFGGSSDCGCDLRAEGGEDCGTCGGHLESEDEPDLDPGHEPDCIQLNTCMALHGKPQRARRGTP